MRHDLAVGELAHLLADGIQRLIETAVADRGRWLPGHQLDQARAVPNRIAGGDQEIERRRPTRRDLAGHQAEIREPQDLALAHRNAAGDLGDVFAESDADDQFFEFAETTDLGHARRIGRELAHGLDISRKPGEPVRGALLRIEALARNTAIKLDAGAHLAGGIGEQSFERTGGVTGERDQTSTIRIGRMHHDLVGYAGGCMLRCCIAAHKRPYDELRGWNTDVRIFVTSYRVALAAFRRFNADDGWAIASHIALSTLMALFPFLIVLGALARFFGLGEIADDAVDLMFQTWPEEVADRIGEEVHAVLTTNRPGMLTINLVLCVYFASSGVESLRIGLNRAYGAKERRNWIILRVEAIAYVMVTLASLLTLGFLIVLGPLIFATAVEYAPWLAPLEGWITIARYAIATLVLVIALMLVHAWLPAGRRPLGVILPGIVATLLMWLDLRRHLRPLSGAIRADLRDLLLGSFLGDDCACVSLFHGADLRLWRRAQQRHRGAAPDSQAREVTVRRRRPLPACLRNCASPDAAH